MGRSEIFINSHSIERYCDISGRRAVCGGRSGIYESNVGEKKK